MQPKYILMAFYVELQQYIFWNNVKTLQKVGPSATFNNAPR